MPILNISSIPPSSYLGRVLRLPLRLIPANSKVPILQGPIRGYKWCVDAGAHGFWLGCYETPMQELLAQKLGNGQTFYDLGANVGFYSLLASSLVGIGGSVISFEPLPRNLKFLKTHIEVNKRTNCRVVSAAVGSVNGRQTFDIGAHHSMGKIVGSEYASNSIEVETVTLDELVFAKSFPVPNVIKIDVEGAEADALKGAQRLLLAHRPLIILSTHGVQVHKECLDILYSLGYKLTSMNAHRVEDTDEVLAE